MITEYPTLRARWAHRPTGEANPFEVYLLTAGLLIGGMSLTGVGVPGSINIALPHSFVIAWAALLAGGAGIALAGLFWPGNLLTGPEVKRVGLVGTSFAALAYGVAAASLGPPGYAAAVNNVLFAVACMVRVRQVTLKIQATRTALTDSNRG